MTNDHFTMISDEKLKDFITESNKIERVGSHRTSIEYGMYREFLTLPVVGLQSVESFVYGIKGGLLRSELGMNIGVGSHIAPMGGATIVTDLRNLLLDLNMVHPFIIHSRYETLHPFMDGNGRSGRAIWLWQMLRLKGGTSMVERFGFLQTWYYQSLDNNRK